jgi:hypothetical protein
MWRTSRRWLKSYFPMIDFEILSFDIFDKRLKYIFQPADPTTLLKIPQIPALCGAHLGESLNIIFQ